MKGMILFILFFFTGFLTSLYAETEIGSRLFDKAYVDYKKGLYLAAEKNIKQIIKIAPDNVTYHHLLGKIYFKLEKFKKSKHHLLKACSVDVSFEPKFSFLELTNDLAKLYYKTNQFKKASELFQQIYNSDRSDYLSCYHAGISLFKIRKYSEALQYMKIVSDRLPATKGNAFYVAGLCYEMLGKNKKAEKAFKDARHHAHMSLNKQMLPKILSIAH